MERDRFFSKPFISSPTICCASLELPPFPAIRSLCPVSKAFHHTLICIPDFFFVLLSAQDNIPEAPPDSNFPYLFFSLLMLFLPAKKRCKFCQRCQAHHRIFLRKHQLSYSLPLSQLPYPLQNLPPSGFFQVDMIVPALREKAVPALVSCSCIRSYTPVALPKPLSGWCGQ